MFSALKAFVFRFISEQIRFAFARNCPAESRPLPPQLHGPRTEWLWLPGPDGAVAAVADAPRDLPAARTRLASVG